LREEEWEEVVTHLYDEDIHYSIPMSDSGSGKVKNSRGERLPGTHDVHREKLA